MASAGLHYRLDEAWNGDAEAPVLVLAHSLGTSLEIWEPQVEALRRNLRLLRYDARGHGLSFVRDGEYTLKELGQDVIGLMDSLQIQKAHFCGVSLGGLVGLWLGAHTGHRLRSLIAVDTAARIGTRATWDTRMATVQADALGSIVEGTLERWFTPDFRAEHAEQVAATRRMFLATAVEGYIGCCAALRDADLTEAVRSIDVPTLIMTGSQDAVTPVADGRFLAQQIARARFVELDGAHLAHVEDGMGFVRNMVEFVA